MKENSSKIGNKVISIVTPYNGINAGSYWQAYSLMHTLKSMGYSVFFVELSNTGALKEALSSKKFVSFLKFLNCQSLRETTKSKVPLFRNWFRTTKCNVKKLRSYLKRFDEYKTAQKIFQILSKEKATKISKYIFLGSDTIWNLDSPYYMNNNKIYWGSFFKENNVASYAVSVANTSFETIKNHSFTKSCLQCMGSISVRDKHTKEIIKRLTDKTVFQVCDPTMLLEKEDFISFLVNYAAPKKKFIFLYLFAPLSAPQQTALKKLAIEKGLTIINGTCCRQHCDINMLSSPYSFLQHMAYAEYVITDTFHGNIFSIIFNKNFVCIDRNKNKVTDLLEAFELLDRKSNDELLLDLILEKPIDYEKPNQIKSKLKADSLDYISMVLEGKYEQQ